MLVLFIALCTGVFALLSVALWATTDPRFGKYAFSKPEVTRSTFFSRDKELSDWIFMYYTARVGAVSWMVVLGYYLFALMT